MGLVSALKSVQNLSKQKIGLEKQILRIQQKANIAAGAGKTGTVSQRVAEMADRFTPTIKEDAVKEFAKKAGKGFKGKLEKWLEEFVENMKRMHGMS